MGICGREYSAFTNAPAIFMKKKRLAAAAVPTKLLSRENYGALFAQPPSTKRQNRYSKRLVHKYKAKSHPSLIHVPTMKTAAGDSNIEIEFR